MRELAERVLAHDRVAANRRNTRLLVLLLFVLLLPALSGLAVWLMPLMEFPLVLYLEHAGWDSLEHVPLVTLLAVMSAVTAVLVGLAGVVLTLVTLWRYGARIVLHAAKARAVPREAAGELGRLLEGLSIAAGVATPALALVDSPSPNAFSVGRDPAHVTVGVTHGLLGLLDRRELEGVLAHELAHVANEDTRIETLLAAVVATVTLPVRVPWRLVTSPRWPARVVGALWGIGGLQVLLGTLVMFGSLVAGDPGPYWFSESDGLAPSEAGALYWLAIVGSAAPFYLVCITPAIALGLRGAVSRERELLADAEATLMTRDPEGLALALAKIGAASGALGSIESLAHLFVVDPRPGSLWHGLFPTHPSLERRIALLGQMGSGLNPNTVATAMEAGAAFRVQAAADAAAAMRRRTRSGRAADGVEGTPPPAGSAVESQPPDRTGQTPIYEHPDGWSRVVAWLPRDAPVTSLREVNGNFVRVETPEGPAGWVARSAPLRISEAALTSRDARRKERDA